ncbi:hypothetical protein ACQ4PT_024289 [Festuca glaucescens]
MEQIRPTSISKEPWGAGCYPAFLVELPHNGNDLDEYGCMTTYNSAVVYYNDLLNNSLARDRKTLQDASIVYVDKYSIMLELFQHPEAHGLKYATKACCGYGDGAYNFNPDLYCGNSKLVDGHTTSATACQDPQNYVSWDGIHHPCHGSCKQYHGFCSDEWFLLISAF